MKTLEEYKKELLAILDRQEKVEERKGKSEDFKKSLIDMLGDWLIEKGRAANIGEVREWKGKKYIKIAAGKWRPKYDSSSRGALQSIRLTKKKIANAKSMEELISIIKENRMRFTDSNGKALPIVKEIFDSVGGKHKEFKTAKKQATSSTSKTNQKDEEKKERYVPKTIEEWDSSKNFYQRLDDGTDFSELLKPHRKEIQKEVSDINKKYFDKSAEFRKNGGWDKWKNGEKEYGYQIAEILYQQEVELSNIYEKYVGDNEPQSIKDIKEIYQNEVNKYKDEYEKSAREQLKNPKATDEVIEKFINYHKFEPSISERVNAYNINDYCKEGYLRTKGFEVGLQDFEKIAVKEFMIPIFEAELKRRHENKAPKSESKVKEETKKDNVEPEELNDFSKWIENKSNKELEDLAEKHKSERMFGEDTKRRRISKELSKRMTELKAKIKKNLKVDYVETKNRISAKSHGFTLYGYESHDDISNAYYEIGKDDEVGTILNHGYLLDGKFADIKKDFEDSIVQRLFDKEWADSLNEKSESKTEEKKEKAPKDVKEMTMDELKNEMKEIVKNYYNLSTAIRENQRVKELYKEIKDKPQREAEENYQKKKEYYGNPSYVKGKTREGYPTYSFEDNGLKYEILGGKFGCSWTVTDKNGKEVASSLIRLSSEGRRTLTEAKDEVQRAWLSNKPDIPENANNKTMNKSFFNGMNEFVQFLRRA